MAEYTYIGGNQTALKTLLESSGYFDSVAIEEKTYYQSGSTNNYTGVACYIDEVLVFYIGTYPYSSSPTLYPWSFFITPNRTTEFEYGNTGGGEHQYYAYRPQKAYKTPNGIIIVCDTGRILITKNQNGKVVIACGANKPSSSSNNTANYVMSTVAAIAVTDDIQFVAHNMDTAHLASQTLTVPICTCASTASYTDKAGLLEYRQFNVIGNIQYNGKRYFTDGYFTIEDPLA